MPFLFAVALYGGIMFSYTTVTKTDGDVSAAVSYFKEDLFPSMEQARIDSKAEILTPTPWEELN